MEYNEDFNYEFGVNKFVLSYLGSWPLSEGNFFVRQRLLIDVFLVIIGYCIPRLITVYIVWGELDFVVSSCTFNISFTIGVIKMITMYRRKQDLANILNSMAMDWTIPLSNEEYKIALKMATLGRKISIVSTSITLATVVAGIIAQVWFNLEADLIKNQDARVKMNIPWVCYLPYDTTHAFNYITTMLTQVYLSVVCAFGYVTFDNLCVVLVLHLCGQLGLVQTWLRHLNKCPNPNDFWSRLRHIVNKHQQLIQLATEFEHFFRVIIFLQLSTCTVMFCFQGYSLMTNLFTGQLNIVQTMFSLAYTSYIGLHVFFYCWAGEILQTQSVAIGYAIYECKWYYLSPEQAQSLMVISYKSRRPLVLTVGKFAPLSFNLFLRVLKTSMSYLSVLLAVKG